MYLCAAIAGIVPALENSEAQRRVRLQHHNTDNSRNTLLMIVAIVSGKKDSG